MDSSNIINFPIVPKAAAYAVNDGINFAAQIRAGAVSVEEISSRSENQGFKDWFNWIGMKIWRSRFVAIEGTRP